MATTENSVVDLKLTEMPEEEMAADAPQDVADEAKEQLADDTDVAPEPETASELIDAVETAVEPMAAEPTAVETTAVEPMAVEPTAAEPTAVETTAAEPQDARLETDADVAPETDTALEKESAPPTETPKEAKPERTSRRKKQKKRPSDPGMVQVTAWFAACGRCSFFLAGYKVIVGEEALQTAVSQRDEQWLNLTWNHAVTNLVHKSYGSRVDIHCYHYEGRCQECRRRFIYHAAEDDSAPTFRIELKT